MRGRLVKRPVQRVVSSFDPHQLALILGKNPDHLQSRNVRRLLSDGRLVYRYPTRHKHPQQKYMAAGEHE